MFEEAVKVLASSAEGREALLDATDQALLQNKPWLPSHTAAELKLVDWTADQQSRYDGSPHASKILLSRI